MATLDREQREDENRRALRRVEATALLLLLRAKRRVHSEAQRQDWTDVVVADRLRTELATGVIKIRRAAFEARVRRLAKEAEALGATVLVSPQRTAGILGSLDASGVVRRVAEQPTKAGIRRVAVTETAKAYSDVHVLPQSGVLLFRRWDAMLDACPICWALDGQTVPLGQPFVGGEPGNMHPHCRCVWSLVAEYEIRAAA